jgi:exosortase
VTASRAILAALLVLSVVPVCVSTLDWWLHNDLDLVSFSLLMPLAAGAACWVRWRQIDPDRDRPDSKPGGVGRLDSDHAARLADWVLGLSAATVALSAAGWALREPIFGSMGLWLGAAALAGIWLGARTARRALLPLFPLVFVAPLTRDLPAHLEAVLQRLSAGSAVFWLGLFGTPVTRRGVVLETPTFQNVVDDTCSGVSTLSALAILTLLLGLIVGLRDRRTVLAMALAVPLTLAINGARIAWISVLGEAGGAELALARHDLTGWVTFGTGYALLLLGVLALRRGQSAKITASTSESGPSQ